MPDPEEPTPTIRSPRSGSHSGSGTVCPDCGLRWLDGRVVCTHHVEADEREWVEFPE
jgi:uncharacterized OB-fold protein